MIENEEEEEDDENDNGVDDDDDEEEREGGGLGFEGEDMGCDMEMVGMCFFEFFYIVVGLFYFILFFVFIDGICW